MTLVLELPADVEQRLRDETAQEGKPVEEYALTRLTSPNSKEERGPLYDTATPEEQAKAYLKWAQSHSNNSAPPIPDAAPRREALYKD